MKRVSLEEFRCSSENFKIRMAEVNLEGFRSSLLGIRIKKYEALYIQMTH